MRYDRAIQQTVSPRKECIVHESPVTLQIVHHVRSSRLGRRRLAERTGLTEMTVRIELERLRDRGLIELPRAGVVLTSAGCRRFGPLLDPIRSVERVNLDTLRVDDVALAARVARRAVEPAWALRDHAIREGATGFLLLRLNTCGWAFIHDEELVQARNPGDAAMLESVFPEASSGDLLLVTSAPDLRRASLGLWGAILAVLKG
jgi:DNA-binding transcriptional ArsR family regulator